MSAALSLSAPASTTCDLVVDISDGIQAGPLRVETRDSVDAATVASDAWSGA